MPCSEKAELNHWVRKLRIFHCLGPLVFVDNWLDPQNFASLRGASKFWSRLCKELQFLWTSRMIYAFGNKIYIIFVASHGRSMNKTWQGIPYCQCKNNQENAQWDQRLANFPHMRVHICGISLGFFSCWIKNGKQKKITILCHNVLMLMTSEDSA